jgi:pimeloyl-ACP methyl ester carboxylesterase
MPGRVALVVLLIMLALAGWLIIGQYTRAAGVLVLAAEIDGWPRAVSRLHTRRVEHRMLQIPTREGMLRAREFIPEGRVRRTAVLIAGVHPAGIDDPRFVHFAESVAATGMGVVTPQLPGLVAFEIAPSATDSIEDVTSWAAAQDRLAGDGRVGLIGISFSGGLSIVAAGRAALRDRVAFVLSIGGHGDLVRTLDVIGGGILSEQGGRVDPFGLAMVVASVADRAVPSEQVGALREWARTYLEAAHLPADEPIRAQLFATAERLRTGLPEPAATLVSRVLVSDVPALRRQLLPSVRQLAADAALSPERAPAPAAPVFLLHGTDDPVIPPTESRHLAEHLRPLTSVRVLLTPILSHADVESHLTIRDSAALVAFLAGVLRQ